MGEIISITIARATCNSLDCFLVSWFPMSLKKWIYFISTGNAHLTLTQSSHLISWSVLVLTLKVFLQDLGPGDSTTFIPFTLNGLPNGDRIAQPPTRCLFICFTIWKNMKTHTFWSLKAYPPHKKWSLMAVNGRTWHFSSGGHFFPHFFCDADVTMSSTIWLCQQNRVFHPSLQLTRHGFCCLYIPPPT